MNKMDNFVSDLEDFENGKFDKIGAIYDSGEKFKNDGNYKKAIKLFIKASKLDPDDSNIYKNLGDCYDKMKLPHLSIKCYKKEVSIEGTYTSYYDLSIEENRAGDYSNSLKHMEIVLTLCSNTDEPVCYNELCIINSNAGNNHQALIDGKRAISLDKNCSTYYYDTGVVESKLGYYNNAINYLKHALMLSPGNKLYIEALGSNRTSASLEESLDNLPNDISYDGRINYTKKLNNMIGLKNVKAAIKSCINRTKIGTLRTGKTNHGEIHLVFEGNPGTGKTTVAKLLCDIFYQQHIIKYHHCVYISAPQLISKNYGSSAKNVRRVIKRSMGGVLFIDEAYHLAHDTKGNSAAEDEALTQLISSIEKYKNNIVVIMAGYEKEMNRFINHSNPGLQSRFPMYGRIKFPDYSNEECIKILYLDLRKNHFQVTSKKLLNRYMNEFITTKRNDSRHVFSNARTVGNIYRKLYDSFSNRLMCKYSQTQLIDMEDKGNPIINTITSNDINNTFNQYNLRRHGSAIDKLNQLIGLHSVKLVIRDHISQVKVSKIRHDDVSNGTNLVFEGNPGTGKTTVAKLFCKILYQKGITKSNNYVYKSAPSFFSKWVGQSAKNMRDAFHEARNGVLFIDEAYALNNKNVNRSGLVSELVSDISQYKGHIVVILAGYRKAMEKFLNNANDGLSSRFSDRIKFPDYSKEECRKILKYDMNKDSLTVNHADIKGLLIKGLDKYIQVEKSNNQHKFANARTVYVFFKQLKRNFNNRLGKLSMNQLKKLSSKHSKKLNSVTLGDVKNTIIQMNQKQSSLNNSSNNLIGFGFRV